MELAPTPEQKQEILRLFKLESEPVVENQYDYMMKVIQGILAEDKCSSFLCIRKGKVNEKFFVFQVSLVFLIDAGFEIIATYNG